MVLAMGICGMATTMALADDSMVATNPPITTLTAQQFVSDALVGGMKEVYLSELALNRSQNADIKFFAHRMMKDHRSANKKLERLAGDEGFSLPATNAFSTDDPNWNNPQVASPESLKGAQLLTMTNLPYRSDYLAVQSVKASSGKDFDQAYVSVMLNDHVAAVNEFKTASQSLTDEKLKKFADKTLPALQHHLMMARQLNTQINASGVMFMPTNHVESSAPKQPYIAPVP